MIFAAQLQILNGSRRMARQLRLREHGFSIVMSEERQGPSDVTCNLMERLGPKHFNELTTEALWWAVCVLIAALRLKHLNTQGFIV